MIKLEKKDREKGNSIAKMIAQGFKIKEANHTVLKSVAKDTIMNLKLLKKI
jgi:hypothetical protein